MAEIPPPWMGNADWSMPFWRDYRTLLKQLDGTSFPDAACLQRLLPAGSSNLQGKPIRFVAASQLGKVQYEAHIFDSGEVSTREHNWHDLFNALVWCRLPALKAAMNAVHFRQIEAACDGARGPQRDALTLLDESGVIVVGNRLNLLAALARRDWPEVFRASHWKQSLRVIVCGHALLEKFLEPYKSITAHALLVHVGGEADIRAEDLLANLDSILAGRLLEGTLLESPADLSPLPLMGIPGWWPAGEQDSAFYDDPGVFRVPARSFKPVEIINI